MSHYLDTDAPLVQTHGTYIDANFPRNAYPIITLESLRFTNLFYSNTVSVVPKRHDEYPRFISAAWPYYAGALSTSIGFVAFSIVYLGGEVDRKAKGKSKTE